MTVDLTAEELELAALALLALQTVDQDAILALNHLAPAAVREQYVSRVRAAMALSRKLRDATGQ